jgi:hypothetical protein
LPELLNRSKKKEIVFLFFDFSQLVSIVCRMFDFYLWSSARSPKQRMSVGPQKGAIQAQSQAIYRDLNHDGFNLSLPNWSGADIGPRYSLSTLTIGNTNVRLL